MRNIEIGSPLLRLLKIGADQMRIVSEIVGSVELQVPLKVDVE